MMKEPIYAAYGTGSDRDHLIGYFTGDRLNIADYINNSGINIGYGLRIDEIKVRHITSEESLEVVRLNAAKTKLENELKIVKNQLAKYGRTN